MYLCRTTLLLETVQSFFVVVSPIWHPTPRKVCLVFYCVDIVVQTQICVNESQEIGITRFQMNWVLKCFFFPLFFFLLIKVLLTSPSIKWGSNSVTNCFGSFEARTWMQGFIHVFLWAELKVYLYSPSVQHLSLRLLMRVLTVKSHWKFWSSFTGLHAVCFSLEPVAAPPESIHNLDQ